MIAGNNAAVEVENAIKTSDAPCAAASTLIKPTIGTLPTTRPPTRRAMTDVPASAVVATAAVPRVVRSSTSFTSCWMPPTCAPSISPYATVAVRKNRVRSASAYSVPNSTGVTSSCCMRAPSGRQPRRSGSGRTSHSANGTIPRTHTTPRTGVAAARPRSSINHFDAGVSRIPPADNPVEATDSATERRAWYHLVITVVTGINPAPEKPSAKTA